MSVTLYTTGPVFTVQIGVSTAASGGFGVWNVSTWNGTTSLWGPDIIWTDITQYVRACSTFIGRSREEDRYQASTMNLTLDNRDGRFTPANLSGPYVSAGVTQLRPKLWIRAYTTYAGSTQYHFTGRTTAWEDNFVAAGKDALTQVTALDQMADLAGFNGIAVSPVGADELTSLRLQRVIRNAGIVPNTSTYRTFMAGANTVQATTLAGNASTEVDLTVDSEGGAFWVEGDGGFVFDDQTALFTSAKSITSQVTFSKNGGTDVGFIDPTIINDDPNLRNIISYARAGGSQVTSSDLTSRALYGDLSYGRSDLICSNDTQVSTLVARDLIRWKDPEYRVGSVVVIPRFNPTVYWPHVLQRRIRDRAVVTLNVPVSGLTITRNVFIDGIQHDITPDNWVTTYHFASATVYDAYTASLWDTGKWDSALWF